MGRVLYSIDEKTGKDSILKIVIHVKNRNVGISFYETSNPIALQMMNQRLIQRLY